MSAAERFRSRYKAEPQLEWEEPQGPPKPWDLYALLTTMANAGLPKGHRMGVGPYQWANMQHQEQVDAIEFYRGLAVEEEMRNWEFHENQRLLRERIARGVAARAERDRLRDEKILAEMGDRVGAW